MRTRILHSMAALALVFGLFGLAPGFTPEPVSGHMADCTHISVRLYEGFNKTGDFRDFCSRAVDLNNYTHTQTGNCDSHLLGDNSWDDCASSWAVIQNDHSYCIQIFSNPLGALQWPLLEGGFRAAGYWSNFDSGEDNKASGIEITAPPSGICGSNG